MFDKRIAKYLVKIKRGENISFSTFLSLLPESLQEDIRNTAKVEPKGKGLSRVEIYCDALNERLYQLTVAPDNRIEATLKGDSHKVNASTSYLLAYHEKSTSIQPETIVINNEGAYYQFEQKKQVVIIENVELFFAKNVLINQLNLVFDLQLSIDNTDLLYGAGNQVSNQINKKFLNKYETVWCFFDYDLGGIKIFKAMKNMLGEKAKFIEPTHKSLRKFFIKKPKSNHQYFQALKGAKELELMILYSCLLSESAFMEQEAILAFK